jgi:hypothetical protein
MVDLMNQQDITLIASLVAAAFGGIGSVLLKTALQELRSLHMEVRDIDRRVVSLEEWHKMQLLGRNIMGLTGSQVGEK